MVDFVLGQMDFVYFVYGLAFLLLAAAAHSLVASSERRLPWIWLAYFGVAHGINEWMVMLLPALGDSPLFAGIRWALITLAFLCLLEFGRAGTAALRGDGKPGRWVFVPFLVLESLGAFKGLLGLGIAVRYALGFPAGLWAAYVFWRVSRSGGAVQRSRRMVAVAAAMLVYAIGAGLVVPKGDFPPASLLNHWSFLAFVGLPVQFFRSVIACCIAVLLWRHHCAWRRTTFPTTATARALRFENLSVLAMSLVLVCGWIAAEGAGWRAQQNQAEELRRLTTCVASALNPDSVKDLSGTPEDVTRDAYQRLHRKCRQICNSNPDIRYVYLLREKDDAVVFLMDSEAERPSSAGNEPTATPGDRYSDMPERFRGVFRSGQATTVGPYKDRWGTFFSGLAPITVPETGRVAAVLGIDINATQWTAVIAVARLSALLITALILGLSLIFFVLWRQAHEDAEAQARATDRTHRHQGILLAMSPAVAAGDIPGTARHITEGAAHDFGVARTAVWMGSRAEGRFVCLDAFERAANGHDHGAVRAVESFAVYFGALEQGRVIDAHRCALDPRVAELRRARQAHGSSALHVPIQVSGRLAGALCIEHAGLPRRWADNEIQFAVELADQMAHALMNAESVKAAAELRKAHAELEERVRERTQELSRANEELNVEIAERKRSEQERMRLEERIRHAEKLESLGLMAGGIAHDFNNILMVILGNLELLRTEVGLHDGALANLEEAEKAARRAAGLSGQMLAYSGKGRFVSQPANLAEVITEMAHMLEAGLSKKVKLAYEFAPDLPTVEADLTQVRQIVMNLVTNANDAIGHDEGRIVVSLQSRHFTKEYLANTWLKSDLPGGEYVALEVSDNGCGMGPETVAKIFDPFFSTKFLGRGLGLAAVLGIVRGHHGAIEVESEPGRGTLVRVLFPVIAGPAASIPGPEPAARLWCGSGKVLLVDDEDTVRVLGSRMLRRLGFEVVTAGDGRTALELFERNWREITFVLLDLTMPEMDGRETLAALRQIHRDVMVLLCSGYTEEDMVRRFAKAPPAGFLHKPYTLGELSAHLEGLALNRG